MMRVLAGWGALSLTAAGASAAVSTFDGSAEGWSVVEFNGPVSGAGPTPSGSFSASYHATGGNPGGYISATGASYPSIYFSAPAQFLGNQLASLGGPFSFDLANDSPNPEHYPQLILVGTTESIYYSSSMVSSTFTTYTHTMSAGGAFVNAVGGLSASNADFAAVLGNLQAIYISGESVDVSNIASLDNVSLPEPGALSLTAAVAAGALHRRRRRSGRP